MAFAPAIPYPDTLPPQFAAAAALATRVEGLLTRFCENHPDEDAELLMRVGRAVWNMTAVHKTIYLLAFPGADRRHRRGKPDPTMTFLEHRVSELHDWVAEYQRLVLAMKKRNAGLRTGSFSPHPTPTHAFSRPRVGSPAFRRNPRNFPLGAFEPWW